jgi:hypothetical protein
MSSHKSSQGRRVSEELEVLRQKQLAKSQRDKLKDCKYGTYHAAEVKSPSLHKIPVVLASQTYSATTQVPNIGAPHFSNIAFLSFFRPRHLHSDMLTLDNTRRSASLPSGNARQATPTRNHPQTSQ